ncbi:MAG: enoyl-CoA hydratase/isomerase family protein [Deltaproteobacteria bacterium]|nr:enoyl-CoA hydratase/isomerase family protein [Deltaproteobacteria bacterium]
MQELTYTIDERTGIATLEIDTPGPVNTIGSRLITELDRGVERARSDGASGVILASAKKRSFLDGANLAEIMRDPSPLDLKHLVLELQETLSRLARSPFPVAAVLTGQTALGGGFETLLWACDRVFASTGTKMGLPETGVGLFPAAGGADTLRRLAGLETTLDIVLRGRVLPAEAFEPSGLVTMVKPDAAMDAAAAWLAKNPSLTNRNYDPGWKEPDLDEQRALVEKAREKHLVCPHRPWLAAALDAIEEGLGLPLDEAARRAADRFAPLIMDPNVRNKIDLFFTVTSIGPRLARVNAKKARPADTVAVIGAGLMGQGVAQVCADSGMKVLLFDVDEDTARAAREKVGRTLAPLVQKGRWLPERRDRILASIEPTVDYGRLEGVDLAIENVFENLPLKQEILARVQDANPDIVIASNTSTLPMQEISSRSDRPEQVVGMHYFSPVPLMPLLEVIRGPATSEAALATAVTVGRRQKKTCIVVGDGPGFYTSRTFGVFVMTGFYLAEMGLDPARIDRLALEAGFPQGPLNVYGTAGGNVIYHAAQAMKERMPDLIPVPESLVKMYEAGYLGAGKPCFYTREGEPDASALEHVVRSGDLPVPGQDEAREMLVLSMVNQAFLCLDEGVLDDYMSMDLGAILGVGFPDCWHGPARYVSQKGVRATLERLEEIHDRYAIDYFKPAMEFSRIIACGVDRGLV